METHKSLSDARQAFAGSTGRWIIEIDHAAEGHCFIGAKLPMANLAMVLKSNPMPEIKSLIAEHSVLSASEMEAKRKAFLRNQHCHRCGACVDGNVAYSQQERDGGMKVTAFYCDSCHALLASMGAGEVSDLEERAASRNSCEPETKTDY